MEEDFSAVDTHWKHGAACHQRDPHSRPRVGHKIVAVMKTNITVNKKAHQMVGFGETLHRPKLPNAMPNVITSAILLTDQN